MPTIALYCLPIRQIAKESFPLSYHISDGILNLPGHQDTTTGDIRGICGEIAGIFVVRPSDDGFKH